MDRSRPTRRTFLASVVATAVAAGCSSDSDSGGNAGANSGTGQPDATTAPSTTATPPTFASDPFSLGVASGDPDDSSVILWTRLAPDPMDGNLGGMAPDTGDVSVAWEVATDEEFASIVASGVETAVAALSHSVHVEAGVLEPDSWYFYRFSVGDETSPTGRTRTMPAPDASVGQLSIAFASCQSYTNGYYTAYDQMASDDLDLVLFLGDYIYESPGDGIRTISGGTATDIEGYRRLYGIYKSDKSLQAAHASCPWVLTWDDHEVENNHADLVNDGGMGPEEFATRRAAAYQAYYENQPLRLDPPQSEDWEIYRTIRCGNLAEFFVLDGRQYRDDQPCDVDSDAIVSGDACADLDDDRTMLGDEQEAWLESGLANSTAVWKGLAQQTVMSSLILGNIVLNVDQWDGYAQARQRLLASIEDDGVENVVVMTGDIHSAGAGVLSTDAGAAVAVEFVCTSITSSSLVDRVPGGADIVIPAVFDGIEYLNVRDHGYCRATITPDTWSTDFVIVDTIESPESGASVDATFVVRSGIPELI